MILEVVIIIIFQKKPRFIIFKIEFQNYKNRVNEYSFNHLLTYLKTKKRVSSNMMQFFNQKYDNDLVLMLKKT